MNETKLKPCPFCGGIAEIKHDFYDNDQHSYVRCRGCRCKISDVQISTEYSSDEKAAERWNRRVDDAEIH